MEEIYSNSVYKVLLPNEIKDIINVDVLNYIKNNISIEILSENIIPDREISSLWLYGKHVCGRCMKKKSNETHWHLDSIYNGGNYKTFFITCDECMKKKNMEV